MSSYRVLYMYRLNTGERGLNNMKSDSQILKEIRNHQISVKELVNEIEARHHIEDACDDELWTWGMTIDKQGGVMTVAEMERQLVKYKQIKANMPQ